MPRIELTVEPPFPKHIKRLQEYPQIANQEFRRFADEVLVLAVPDVKARTPVDSGRLRASVGGKVAYAKGDIVRGAIYLDARRVSRKYPSGFPYGYALDVGKKRKFRSGGRRTRGFMSFVFRRKKQPIGDRFEQAVRRILERLSVRR